ncbi:LysR family transcriptional regulator [Brenneria izadpanahii]|uniref:LysR family transcriptional regulator n=1 Tax=Brenneria izadpanahii TaxID=2722756 RepID=A0ABX7UNA9_9GAMM|nr:LysR family transcriptional regulator [Brenneria izadpanahii]QTF06999.1 LysR family transcriptional regulator [Brenneria izadpanahii]
MRINGIDRLGDRRVTLEHLRIFTCIAEDRSFQLASIRLHRTQSALTQSLQKFEEILGCRLIIRSQGHIAGLTPDGERLLPAVREILYRLSDAISSIKETEFAGYIRLGVPDDFKITDILSAISYCLTLNPALRLQITSALSAQLVNLINQGDLDIAIFKHTKSEKDLGGIGIKNTRLLWSEPLHWVSKNKLNFNELNPIPCIFFPEGCAYRSAGIDILAAQEKAYYTAYESASYENIKLALASGLGISILPQSAIDKNHKILSSAEGFPEPPKVHLTMATTSKGEIYKRFGDFIKKSAAFTIQPH